MRSQEFVRCIVEASREQGKEIWEQVKRVKDRESMLAFEESCSGLGMAVGSAAFAKGVEAIEGRRRSLRCHRCGRRMERSRRRRRYYTLVGSVEVQRFYYHCRPCGEGRAPLDDWVEGRESRLSFGVQRKLCELSSEMGFKRAAEKLHRLCGLNVSKTATWRHTVRWARGAVAHCPQRRAGPATTHVSIDAGKVNTIRGGWRDMKLAVFEAPGGGRRWYSMQIGPPTRWGQTLRRTAGRLGVAQTDTMCVWGDGASWIWKLSAVNFPGATCILDFYHAMENLAQYGRVLWGPETPALAAWLEHMGHQLKTEGGRAVYETLQGDRPRRRAVRKEHKRLLGYLKARLHMMDYPAYIAQGLEIGSGVVESACKDVIGRRLKGGRRWHRSHALAIGTMRGLFLADEWDDYCQCYLKSA